MARVLVNALSATNHSGRHVLLGHLGQLAADPARSHQFVVLYHRGNADLVRDLGSSVEWIEAEWDARGWLLRSFWERLKLPRVAAAVRADLYFTVSGIAARGLQIPQLVFAQNPWPFVKEIHRGVREPCKAWLQRRAYRASMRRAEGFIFNSEYMRRLYRSHADGRERRSWIVHQAIDDSTHAAADSVRDSPRIEGQLLCVSVMAPHKDAETLVRAMAEVIRKCKRAHLVIAGPWPDGTYRKRVERLAEALGVARSIKILGEVPKATLYKLYAESFAFCLMSRCESFGIPSVEAQAFGTPVLTTNACAMPEICGRGARYIEAGDWLGLARQIEALLENQKAWELLSREARCNAGRFRWAACSRPMGSILSSVAACEPNRAACA